MKRTPTAHDRDMLPEAVLVEAYGCPRCNAHEYGAEDPFAEMLVYRCHWCGQRFRGVAGVHHGLHGAEEPK